MRPAAEGVGVFFILSAPSLYPLCDLNRRESYSPRSLLDGIARRS